MNANTVGNVAPHRTSPTFHPRERGLYEPCVTNDVQTLGGKGWVALSPSRPHIHTDKQYRSKGIVLLSFYYLIESISSHLVNDVDLNVSLGLHTVLLDVACTRSSRVNTATAKIVQQVYRLPCIGRFEQNNVYNIIIHFLNNIWKPRSVIYYVL